MSRLYSAEEILKSLEVIPLWQQEAFSQFSSMIADEHNTYPCVPGRMGYLSGHLRYAFINDPRLDTSSEGLANILRQYGEISRETGPYASLVVICETPTDMKENTTVDSYQTMFWKILSRTTALDTAPWPKQISSDPNDASWEFCFNGEPYFCFCATPAHQQRKSRFFPFFMLAFQPRWVFEAINDDTSLGRKMKTLIRKRLAAYDTIPAHPSLMWYGQENNLEWKQYFLPDDEKTLSKCPFMRMKQTMQQWIK